MGVLLVSVEYTFCLTKAIKMTGEKVKRIRRGINSDPTNKRRKLCVEEIDVTDNPDLFPEYSPEGKCFSKKVTVSGFQYTLLISSSVNFKSEEDVKSLSVQLGTLSNCQRKFVSKFHCILMDLFRNFESIMETRESQRRWRRRSTMELNMLMLYDSNDEEVLSYMFPCIDHSLVFMVTDCDHISEGSGVVRGKNSCSCSVTRERDILRMLFKKFVCHTRELDDKIDKFVNREKEAE